jgi:hypothetical protein
MKSQKTINATDYMACRLNGVTIYRTLRWCNRLTREFWFTTDPEAVDGEAREDAGQLGAMDEQFDARNLPEKYRIGSFVLGWVQRAMLDGFDLSTITNKNLPPPAHAPASLPLQNGKTPEDLPS